MRHQRRLLAVVLSTSLFATTVGCFRLVPNEHASVRSKGGFAGGSVGAGASSFDCDHNCGIEVSDLGFTGTAGAVVSEGAAVSLDGRVLYRASRPEYQHAEIGVSYRRWLIPFFWVSAGVGAVRQTSDALGDDSGRFGAAALAAAAYEFVITDHITLDARVDLGAGAVPDGSYVQAFGGFGISFHTAPVYSRADDEIDFGL